MTTTECVQEELLTFAHEEPTFNVLSGTTKGARVDLEVDHHDVNILVQNQLELELQGDYHNHNDIDNKNHLVGLHNDYVDQRQTEVKVDRHLDLELLGNGTINSTTQTQRKVNADTDSDTHTKTDSDGHTLGLTATRVAGVELEVSNSTVETENDQNKIQNGNSLACGYKNGNTNFAFALSTHDSTDIHATIAPEQIDIVSQLKTENEIECSPKQTSLPGVETLNLVNSNIDFNLQNFCANQTLDKNGCNAVNNENGNCSELYSGNQSQDENIHLKLGEVMYDVVVNSSKDLQAEHSIQSDHLTDSNSSDKMSPLHDMEDTNTVEELQPASVPINFPVRGKILARLKMPSQGIEYFMTKTKMVIGRNSSKGAVDIDVGNSSFISRNHITITYESPDAFFLTCGGKNGVYVENILQKVGAPKLQLPKSCKLRFPSTQIVFLFDTAECFINELSSTDGSKSESLVLPPAGNTLKALSVQIPENVDKMNASRPFLRPFFSPCPSPSGTLSAVNSCPASPTSALVYSKKAITPSGTQSSLLSRYVTDSISVKDSRIPVLDEEDIKPPYSYAQLIVQAISSAPDKQMTLSGIYAYISRNYQYYKANEKGWQNSIRHNLSLNRYFVKVPRSLDEPGKGSFWSIDRVSEPKLVAQAFRRRNKRGIPYFKGATPIPSSLTTQSCPASPINIAFYPQESAASTASGVRPTATLTNNSASQIVTVATANSVAEAITMQSKLPQVIDISSLRAIHSAPGSPQGFQVLSPTSLIPTKMLPKTTSSVIGPKSSGITLLQPVTSVQPVSANMAGKSAPAIVQLTSQQAQMLKSGGTLTTLPVTSLPVTTQISGNSISQAAGSKRPILIQLTSVHPAIDTGAPTAAKVSKRDTS